jgi:hypothetical protein
MTRYQTAICFFHHSEGKSPLKYRNIRNRDNFLKFISMKGVLYCNFYDKATKQYIDRVWLQQYNGGVIYR